MPAQSTERKLSQESVNYRPVRQRRNHGRNCGNCVMYRAANRTCTLVEGIIQPDYVCDRWEGKKK